MSIRALPVATLKYFFGIVNFFPMKDGDVSPELMEE